MLFVDKSLYRSAIDLWSGATFASDAASHDSLRSSGLGGDSGARVGLR